MLRTVLSSTFLGQCGVGLPAILGLGPCRQISSAFHQQDKQQRHMSAAVVDDVTSFVKEVCAGYWTAWLTVQLLTAQVGA